MVREVEDAAFHEKSIMQSENEFLREVLAQKEKRAASEAEILQGER